MVNHHSIQFLLGTMTMVVWMTACQSGTGNLVPTDVGRPMPSTSPASLATSTTVPGDTAPQPQPAILVPPELSLTGKLILSDYLLGIVRFDFSTKEFVPIFWPPENGFVGSATLSPDNRTFLTVYSRPRDIGDPQYGTTDLYTLSADGSGEPSLLMKDAVRGNYYFSPVWSPDGQFVYFGRQYSPLPGNSATKPPGYYLTRYSLPDGPSQDLIRNVLMVRISPDGKKMFYVSLNPDTTLSTIYVANPDGTNPKDLLSEGEQWIIDSLALAPNGETIIFSSANNPSSQSGSSWLNELMGVQVAEAHDLPSDLWIMRVGEKPQQLTHLAANGGFIEDFSPDGRYIVFACSSGVYIIHPDGSGQTKISSQQVFGNLQWVP